MIRRAPLLALLASAVLPASAQVSLLDHIVASYAFDGTATDGSGNGYNLTLSSGAGYTTGLIGQAFNPNGVINHYAARAGDDNALDFGTGEFTVQVWVNYTTLSGEQVLVEKFSGTSGPGWTLTKLSDQKLAFATDNGSTPIIQSSALSIALGSWHQMIARRTGDTLDLFFDNSSVASLGVASSTSAASSVPLLVGRRNATDGRDFTTAGSLDELVIWNRALSNSEIATLYNGGAGLAISAIPEPADCAAATGLLALVLSAWRVRRRHRAPAAPPVASTESTPHVAPRQDSPSGLACRPCSARSRREYHAPRASG